MQVMEVEELFAWCEGRNGRMLINTMLTGDVRPGDWLLTFMDSAREVIDAGRAAMINSALEALDRVAAGETDFDDCFADLIGREPQLPDFLRANGHGNYATPDDETIFAGICPVDNNSQTLPARFPHLNPLPEGEEANERLREFHIK